MAGVVIGTLVYGAERKLLHEQVSDEHHNEDDNIDGDPGDKSFNPADFSLRIKEPSLKQLTNIEQTNDDRQRGHGDVERWCYKPSPANLDHETVEHSD